MDKWVLRVSNRLDTEISNQYYTGKSYIYQGYKYAIVDDISKAKEYSTYNRAMSANKKFRFENHYFSVERKSASA